MKPETTKTKMKLYMFLSDANLSYSAFAASQSDAAEMIRKHVPSVGRLVFLGVQ